MKGGLWHFPIRGGIDVCEDTIKDSWENEIKIKLILVQKKNGLCIGLFIYLFIQELLKRLLQVLKIFEILY